MLFVGVDEDVLCILVETELVVAVVVDEVGEDVGGAGVSTSALKYHEIISPSRI